jgi:hypothetical protein
MFAAPRGVFDVSPQNANSALNSLESALPKNAPITPLQSADPKTLDLKSFRIRTYEKGRGEGGKLLTRNRSAARWLFVAQSLHGVYAHGAVSWNVAGDEGGKEQEDGHRGEGDGVVGRYADQEAG